MAGEIAIVPRRLTTEACVLVCSLYQHYPGFEERMREALRMLLGGEVEKRIEMGLAKDGSGVGGTPSLPPNFRSYSLTPMCFPHFQPRLVLCKQRSAIKCNPSNKQAYKKACTKPGHPPTQPPLLLYFREKCRA